MESADAVGGLVGVKKKKPVCEQVDEPHSVAAAALKRNTIPLGKTKLGAASERSKET